MNLLVAGTILLDSTFTVFYSLYGLLMFVFMLISKIRLSIMQHNFFVSISCSLPSLVLGKQTPPPPPPTKQYPLRPSSPPHRPLFYSLLFPSAECHTIIKWPVRLRQTTRTHAWTPPPPGPLHLGLLLLALLWPAVHWFHKAEFSATLL